MKVRRYTAATMQEAIDQIRRELGPNAVILHSRKVGRSGVLNLLSKPMIEVTAAVDGDAPEARQPVAMPEEQPRDTRERVADHRLGDYLHASVSKERPDVATLVRPSGIVENIRRELVSHDVDELLAEALLRSAVEDLRTADSESLIREYIDKRVERFLRVTGPLKLDAGRPKVLAVVGPTGVGKTTTVAKLAAHHAGLERKNVAIVTVDVYRVAAVEQMRVYARLLKVPIEVVLTPTDLRSTITAHQDKDLILIDSGGRSPYDWMQVMELTAFFKEISEAEIHLALSAATRCKENLAAIDRFSSMNVHALLFTKLDETRDHGSLLTLTVKSKRPVSYLTTGQGIPEHIEPASPGKLARLILHSETGRKVGPIPTSDEHARNEQYAPDGAAV
ncbi:MAG: flagellar biosynthesis protein FlhF [Verrucomicrobia bacterium]|nr:flagellar biosynthesis protein FlhF [Verrucomicrobiota bacterium]